MAGKDDDFFENGTGSGESEETNLDDFFQPAVSEPKPESAPSPAGEKPEFPATAESVPPVQPFPEEPAAAPPVPEAPPAPSAPAGEPSIESLFPTEKGPEPEEDADAEEAVPADESGEKPKKSRSSLKVPRLVIFILIGILVGAVVGGGGYFGYRYFLAGEGKVDVGKKALKALPIIPDKKVAKPGGEGPSAPKGLKAVEAPATPGGQKVKPYKAKPLPEMPPVNMPPKGTWSVHLERLALESSVAKDAEVVRKLGFTPFRAPERKSTSLIEFRVVADYPNKDDAHSAAWKIDDMGYRPRISESGGSHRVEVAVTFSAKDAGEIRKKLEAGGINNVKVLKNVEAKQLQALRAGPFKTKAQAEQAARKLKAEGFAHAMVMKN